MDVENDTGDQEENLFTRRNQTSEIEPQQPTTSSNAVTSKAPTDSQEKVDGLNELEEPTEEFFGDLLKQGETVKKKETETPVKPEPTENEEEEIDPSFFDELLQRSEKEIRDENAEVIRLKRECPTVDAEAEPQQKKNKSDNAPKEDVKPMLKIRTDLCAVPVADVSKKKPSHDPIGESLLFLDNEIVDDEEEEPKLTAQEKISKALERILYAKRAFEKAKSQAEKKFYSRKPVFLYTPIVRKLPSSNTRYTQQIYDNRSPLHTVNNVSFSFNSTTTRLNIREWGLEAPPPAAAKVARILGYDADTLYLKRKSIKIPDKIQKSRSEPTAADPLFEPSNSTLFINATVQTDEVRILPLRRADFCRNVGVQFTPQTIVAGTQTSSAYCGSSVSDLPFMRVINNLNENQLEALEDFVELITEPVGIAGIDIYEKRSRLNKIYKTSQQPSIVAPPPPPSLRRRSVDENNDDDYRCDEKTKREPSRDPRLYPSRNRYQGGHIEPISDWDSASSTKFYGRGGKRR